MVIRIELAAGDAERDAISVSTALNIDTQDSRWQAWLVNSITTQAEEGARRLRDQLVARQALPETGFVPLAAVVPDAGSER